MRIKHNFRLPAETSGQLEQLSKALNASKTAVVVRAIQELFRRVVAGKGRV